MKVYWTKSAERHLDAICSYIAQNSPEYGKRIADRLIKRSEQLASDFHSGRMVPEYESDTIREIIEGSCRIIYRIQKDHIGVLAVIHGAMNLTKGD